MALSDSQGAIGAVTRLLRDHLIRRDFLVSVGKPEQASDTDTEEKLNLFLYETEFDASLRNVQLDQERPAPLWLTLKYLLTAFDDGESSDSADAHELLGQGASALHELNFLRLDGDTAADVRLALENNPEPIKVTFDAAPVDLVSRVMQGSEERYRLSMAFQVRPVMLMPDEKPPFSLLVGVDYTQAPIQIIGADGVQIDAIPSMGPSLALVTPATFEPGDRIRLEGDDLHLSGLDCLLGDVVLRIVGQSPAHLDVEVEGTRPSGATEGPVAGGGAISAGEHPIVVRRALSSTRHRSSNLLLGRLRPFVETATIALDGALEVAGTLLGSEDDDILVALYREGEVIRLFDATTSAADQKSLRVPDVQSELDPGRYQVILRVNGQQARVSPVVVVTP